MEKAKDDQKVCSEKLFLTQARHYSRLGRPNKAIQCIDSAIGNLILYWKVEDLIFINCRGNKNLTESSQPGLLLCSRASYHLELRDWAQALQDAEEVLHSNLTIAQAFSTKIEAFYQMCLFEQVKSFLSERKTTTFHIRQWWLQQGDKSYSEMIWDLLSGRDDVIMLYLLFSTRPFSNKYKSNFFKL